MDCRNRKEVWRGSVSLPSSSPEKELFLAAVSPLPEAGKKQESKRPREKNSHFFFISSHFGICPRRKRSELISGGHTITREQKELISSGHVVVTNLVFVYGFDLFSQKESKNKRSLSCFDKWRT